MTLALPTLRSIGSANGVGIAIALLLAASKSNARDRATCDFPCIWDLIGVPDTAFYQITDPEPVFSRARTLSYVLSCVRASRELGLRAGFAARHGGLVGAHL